MANSNVNTTGVSIDAVMKNYYDTRFLERLVPNVIMEQFAEDRPLPTSQGKNIYFTRYTNLSFTVSAALLQEPSTASSTALIGAASAANVTATIEQYAGGLSMNDLFALTALTDQGKIFTDLLADQAANIIDKRILQACYGVSAGNAPTNVGFCVVFGTNAESAYTLTNIGYENLSAGVDVMNSQVIRQSVARLWAKNVKPYDGGDYALICHTNTVSRLMSDSTWVSARVYSDVQSLYNGEEGKLYGVRVLRDNNIRTSAVGSGGAMIYFSVLLGKGALAVTKLAGGVQTFYKEPGSAGSLDPVNQISTYAWKINFVPAILNLSCGQIIATAD